MSRFTGDTDPPASLVDHAETLGADLRILGRDYRYRMNGAHWDYLGEKPLLGLDHPALRGENQIDNATTVWLSLNRLKNVCPSPRTRLSGGLARTELPGRFQLLQNEPAIIVDVAHNPHAAAVLAKNLKEMGTFHTTHAVFGAMADKDIDGVIALMKDSVDRWYVTDLPLSRAASAETLRQKLVAAGIGHGAGQCVSLFHKASDALAGAKNNARKDDRIVAFGSFWVVTGVTESGDPNPTNHR